MKGSVLYFFSLKLKIIYDSILGCFVESLGITRFFKKMPDNRQRISVLPDLDICSSASKNLSAYVKKK